MSDILSRPQCVKHLCWILFCLSLIFKWRFVTVHSCNGLMPIQHQAMTWTNTDLFLNGPLTYSEWTLSNQLKRKCYSNIFSEENLKIFSAKYQPFCLGFDVLTTISVSSNPAHLCMQWADTLTIVSDDSWTNNANWISLVASLAFKAKKGKPLGTCMRHFLWHFSPGYSQVRGLACQGYILDG